MILERNRKHVYFPRLSLFHDKYRASATVCSSCDVCKSTVFIAVLPLFCLYSVKFQSVFRGNSRRNFNAGHALFNQVRVIFAQTFCILSRITHKSYKISYFIDKCKTFNYVKSLIVIWWKICFYKWFVSTNVNIKKCYVNYQ